MSRAGEPGWVASVRRPRWPHDDVRRAWPDLLPHLAWVEVDLAVLVNNARILKRMIPSGCRLGIVVKANAYGHGLEMAARAAVVGGANQLIVAALQEGLALRNAGIRLPILVTYPVPPWAVTEAVGANLELSVSGYNSARQLLEAWKRHASDMLYADLQLHVEVDTGMGRGGIAPGSVVDVMRLTDDTPRTRITGIWSHLASGLDRSLSQEQVRRLEVAEAAVTTSGRPRPMMHIAASDGVLARTAPAYEMVRVGLTFCGELGLDAHPAPDVADEAAQLRPAMTLKAKPVRLELIAPGATVGYGGEWKAERPSRIATLPVGYADGWARASWPAATALVRGRRVPLVGRVSMDAVCADVTDVDGVAMDDEFVLLGQQGAERITANELARIRASIPNEVLSTIGPRLPRIYRDQNTIVAMSIQADYVDHAGSAPWGSQVTAKS